MATTIAHISDLHFGDVLPGAAESLLRALDRVDPDVVVASGDFTMAGRSGEFAEARAFLEAVRQPVLAVPGNHDIPAYQLGERFCRPLRRYRKAIGPVAEREFERNGVYCLGLNTARPYDLHWNWSHGRFSRRQIRRAGMSFERSPAACKVLVMHHPMEIPDDLPGFRVVGRGEKMMRVLAANRVGLVLSGHLHRSFWAARPFGMSDEAWRVLVVQASTATSSRRRDQPNAFNHLRIDGGTLTLTPYHWEGEDFEPDEPVHFEQTDTGWRPAAAQDAARVEA